MAEGTSTRINHHAKLQRMASISGESFSNESESDDELYREIFFIDNGSQSNIYCNAIIRYPLITQERLLVGTLKGKVSCLERYEDVYAKEKFHSSHSMQAREVYFSYIPGDAEIISMDAFYQHSPCDSFNFLIVGLTIIKTKISDGSKLHFFNIYNAIEPGTEFDIDKLAQVCQHLPLGFIPYQLCHADIYVDGRAETVFLLSGSDKQMHVFRCDDKLTFEERSCAKLFPEFANLPGLVLWMEIRKYAEHKRLSAVGCDNGELLVSLTDVRTTKLEKSWSLSMDGPISSVRFFTFFRKVVDDDNGYKTNGFDEEDDIHLLVTSCLEVSVVFLSVLESGLDNMTVLNQSDQFDSVTCSCIADIDLDGRNEIILGTYGQELLVYKWSFSENGLSDHVRFDLIWLRSFSKPLLAIQDLDLMNDGMQELVVVSLTGVHILQQNVNRAAEDLLEKLIAAFPDQLSVAKYNAPFEERGIGFGRTDYSDEEDDIVTFDAKIRQNDDIDDVNKCDGQNDDILEHSKGFDGRYDEIVDENNDNDDKSGDNYDDDNDENNDTDDGSNDSGDNGIDELEGVINAICSSNNNYNQLQ